MYIRGTVRLLIRVNDNSGDSAGARLLPARGCCQHWLNFRRRLHIAALGFLICALVCLGITPVTFQNLPIQIGIFDRLILIPHAQYFWGGFIATYFGPFSIVQ